MKRILIALVSLLMGAGAARAQAVDAKVCDILAHPKDFDGKMVRITGIVAAGFDEFVIRDTGCKQSVNAIWLAYPTGAKAKAGPTAVITLQLARLRAFNSDGDVDWAARRRGCGCTKADRADVHDFEGIRESSAVSCAARDPVRNQRQRE